MPKTSALHQILPVERSAQQTIKKLMDESKRTFSKDNLFKGQIRTLTHFSEADTQQNAVEHQSLSTTVDENLAYIREPWIEWVDLTKTKDTGNQTAMADIVLDDGTVLANDVPATTLLTLESGLSDLRTLLVSIPTLAAGVEWERSAERSGVYKTAHPIVTTKEVKDMDFRIVSPATAEHPAQIKEVGITRAIGRYETNSQSGMLSVKDKADQLRRLDLTLRAVKKARAAANSTQVAMSSIAAPLFDFICSGSKPE